MSVNDYEQVVPCRFQNEVKAVETALSELGEAILKSPADDGLAKMAHEDLEKVWDAFNSGLILTVGEYGRPANLKPWRRRESPNGDHHPTGQGHRCFRLHAGGPAIPESGLRDGAMGLR